MGPRGLLALMLLHDSRRDTRVSTGGDIVLLEDQDRARWNRAEIEEGLALVEARLRAGPADVYALQAAIAALHARAASPADTDWAQIATLYAALHALSPSPVVRLNHAVAVAMSDGPASGLRLLDALAAERALSAFHLLAAARADMLRRLGRHAEAADAYREALALGRQRARAPLPRESTRGGRRRGPQDQQLEWTVTAESVSAPGLPAKAASHESPKKNRLAQEESRSFRLQAEVEEAVATTDSADTPLDRIRPGQRKGRGYSERSAAIGSSIDARRAGK